MMTFKIYCQQESQSCHLVDHLHEHVNSLFLNTMWSVIRLKCDRCLHCRWPTRGCLAFVETNVNKFAISNHTALKLHVHALRTFPRLIVNMSFISYQIEKLLLQRIMVKTTWRTGLPWSIIFCIMVYHSWCSSTVEKL